MQGYLLPDPTRCAGDKHDFAPVCMGSEQWLRVNGGINAAILNFRMLGSIGVRRNILAVVSDGKVFVAAFVFIPVRHDVSIRSGRKSEGWVFDVSLYPKRFR